MAQLVALGVEVALALGDRRGDDRHLVDDGEVVAVDKRTRRSSWDCSSAVGPW